MYVAFSQPTGRSICLWEEVSCLYFNSLPHEPDSRPSYLLPKQGSPLLEYFPKKRISNRCSVHPLTKSVILSSMKLVSESCNYDYHVVHETQNAPVSRSTGGFPAGHRLGRYEIDGAGWLALHSLSALSLLVS